MISFWGPHSEATGWAGTPKRLLSTLECIPWVTESWTAREGEGPGRKRRTSHCTSEDGPAQGDADRAVVN